MLARFAGALLAFLGVCWLVAWVQAFRERLYLFFLGAAFIALGADLLLGRQLPLAKHILLGLFAVSMLVAIILAVLQTRARLLELASRRRAMEAEMQAYIESLRKGASEKPE